MHNHRIISVVVGLAVAALATSPAAAQQDLRSPDTRDSAFTSPMWNSMQDLRSPDARDAGSDRGMPKAPEVTVVKVPEPVPVSAGGFDWGDAGLGAAVMLMLAGAGGIAVLIRKRSRPAHTAVAG
jgi:hypothetical protein